MDILELDLDCDDNNEPCKGKIFRGKCNYFVNAKGTYIYQERMIPLKRKSCPGCEKCGYLTTDFLPEWCSDGTPPIIDNIENDALYQLTVVNESRDWESGFVDDWDIEFIKIKE